MSPNKISSLLSYHFNLQQSLIQYFPRNWTNNYLLINFQFFLLPFPNILLFSKNQRRKDYYLLINFQFFHRRDRSFSFSYISLFLQIIIPNFVLFWKKRDRLLLIINFQFFNLKLPFSKNRQKGRSIWPRIINFQFFHRSKRLFLTRPFLLFRPVTVTNRPRSRRIRSTADWGECHRLLRHARGSLITFHNTSPQREGDTGTPPPPPCKPKRVQIPRCQYYRSS